MSTKMHFYKPEQTVPLPPELNEQEIFSEIQLLVNFPNILQCLYDRIEDAIIRYTPRALPSRPYLYHVSLLDEMSNHLSLAYPRLHYFLNYMDEHCFYNGRRTRNVSEPIPLPSSVCERYPVCAEALSAIMLIGVATQHEPLTLSVLQFIMVCDLKDHIVRSIGDLLQRGSTHHLSPGPANI